MASSSRCSPPPPSIGCPCSPGSRAQAHLLVPYLRKYPTLQIILDHCGVGVAPPLVGELPPTLQTSLAPTLEERVRQLEGVIDLAQYPNLALKWCHAPATCRRAVPAP